MGFKKKKGKASQHVPENVGSAGTGEPKAEKKSWEVSRDRGRKILEEYGDSKKLMDALGGDLKEFNRIVDGIASVDFRYIDFKQGPWMSLPCTPAAKYIARSLGEIVDGLEGNPKDMYVLLGNLNSIAISDRETGELLSEHLGYWGKYLTHLGQYDELMKEIRGLSNEPEKSRKRVGEITEMLKEKYGQGETQYAE
jgi:hypothetical protein